MKKIKKIIKIKLEHPTGRITIRKFRTSAKTLKGVQIDYLGTSEHFRNEAYPIGIVKRKSMKRRK